MFGCFSLDSVSHIPKHADTTLYPLPGDLCMKKRNERREHERFTTKGKAIVVHFTQGTSTPEMVEGNVVDIGLGGACIAFRKMLHVGTLGVLKFSIKDKLLVKGIEVRSVRYDSGSGNLVGMRFWNDPPTEPLEKLIKQIERASRQDAIRKISAAYEASKER